MAATDERDTIPLFVEIEAEQRDRGARIIAKNLLRKIRVALKSAETGSIYKVRVAVSSNDPEIAPFNLWAQQGCVHEILREALPELSVSIGYEFRWYGAPSFFNFCTRWPPRHRLWATVSSSLTF